MNEGSAIGNRAVAIYQQSLERTGYFQVSVKIGNKQNNYLSIFTKWTGTEKGFELRKADKVIAERTCESFKILLDQNIAIINDLADLKAFVSLGGHSLIAEEVMLKHWPELMQPKIAVRTALTDRYTEYHSIASRYLQRFPKGDFRMKILDRDQYRCRVCGKHADDNIDVRLEVHHIQPWSEGGLTHEGNLITLCQVCHEGAAMIDRDFLLAKVKVAMPALGPDFFDLDNYEGPGRSKVIYYNSNSVTMKLPAVK